MQNNVTSLYPRDIENKLEELNKTALTNIQDISTLKVKFENLESQTKDTINIAREISLQNERFKIILENNAEMMKDTKIDMKDTRSDMKDLKATVEKINLDTSKNTDRRLSGKQIVLGIIAGLTVSILMLLIGAGLSQSGIQ